MLRQWVEHHYADFERDPALLKKLTVFLDTVKGKALRKWIDSIHRALHRQVRLCYLVYISIVIEFFLQSVSEEKFGKWMNPARQLEKFAKNFFLNFSHKTFLLYGTYKNMCSKVNLQ